jgi:hypothetical protein
MEELIRGHKMRVDSHFPLFSLCTATAPVSSLLARDGRKGSGYIRTCYIRLASLSRDDGSTIRALFHQTETSETVPDSMGI